MSIPIKTILTPVDFSTRTEKSVAYAARLARHYAAEVVLLHIIEPAHVDYAMAQAPDFASQLEKMQTDGARAQLAGFASAALDGIRTRHVIARGAAADEILANSKHADLVVMPTQGHGRFREFLIGSVTAKVLHDCNKPVLTGIHLSDPSLTSDWHVSNIVCAIDLGPETGEVLKWGAALVAEFGAKVTVVHVNAESGIAPHIGKMAQDAGLQAEIVVLPGEPHRGVVSTAEARDADLVIIGRGSTPGALGRLRAQAYEIVRKSPCPVLSV
ncbi:MAG: universal stress protein [Bryobacteraceae bacterium]